MQKFSDKEIRNAGLKATGPRMKILEIFQRTENRHMTAEDIYRILCTEGIDMGLATVYRVLTQFEAAGILCKRDLGGGKAYYEIEDGAHHDHLVCTRCGRVQEFFDNEIEKSQRRIAKEHDFVLQAHTMSLYGLCSRCQEEMRNAEAAQD